MGDYTTGQKLGDYEILGVLGAGGMGKVYKVRNTISDRIEAMKILLPDLADQRELAERFLREIKTLASLNHPNIAQLRTALTLDNQLVMIMEYVDGVTLASRLKQGPVPVADAVYYIDQVLDALVYAHHMNIVHRDIKPANMMLTPQGVVKLMDFGIARSGNDSGMTLTGATLGSLNYMSPEQVRGETADARSDLYSVGLSLYEIVTGRLPFRGDSRYSIMVAQLQQAPEPPIVLRPDLPKALNDIILMALSKSPEKRFQSASAFRNALKSAVPQGASALTSSGSPDVYSPNTIVDPTVATPAPAAPPVPTAALRQPSAPVMAAATPAAASSAKTEAPPPAVPKSHRGLYMALGGLLVVAMLAGAAVYVPRRLKTHAGIGATSTSQPAVEPAPATPPPPTAAAPVDQPAAATPEQPAAPPAAPASRSTATTVGAAQTRATHVAHTARPAAAKASERVAAREAAAKQAAQAAAAEAAQQAAEAQAKAAALEEASKRADQLSGRAAAIESSLTSLQREQAAQGYGLRGDMVAAQQRMEANLAQAQAALQQQDAAKAKRYLDRAESDAEKLERFLNQ